MAHTRPAFPPDATVIKSTKPKPKIQATCLVQLGRYGDLINILPACKLIADRWATPYVMASHTFADVLDGVSYVVPEVFPGSQDDLADALLTAEHKFQNVVLTQVSGRDYLAKQHCKTYNMESWRLSGLIEDFRDAPLVFDRRNKDREKALISSVVTGSKPVLLISLSKAISSPFVGWLTLQSEIYAKWAPHFQIIDLATVKAERIYDLLGLMDIADLLITADTSPLHLAAASDVPVVALVNDNAWLATEPRCRCVLKIKYSDASKLAPAIHAKIRAKVISRSGFPYITKNIPQRIVHVVERHMEPPVPRKKIASKSWSNLYKSGDTIPCHYWDYRRDATQIGDKRQLPFLKDVLENGMSMADKRDIVMFTNDDIILHRRLPKLLRRQVSIYNVCTSHRVEIHYQPLPNISDSPESIADKAEEHIGRDLFAFTREWLEKYWSHIPDFILGASEWDLCLAAMVRWSKGIKCSAMDLYHVDLTCDLPMGYVIHEWHEAKWTNEDNVDSAPSQLHNRRLFKEWSAEHMPTLTFNHLNTLCTTKAT